MEDTFNPKNEINQFLKERKDEFYSYSIYILQTYSDILLNTINALQSKDSMKKEDIFFVKHQLLNFISDSSDFLPKSYDNKNKSHREKWMLEKQKLDNIKNDFFKICNSFK